MTPLAEQIHTELTRDQRIGQLFMVATPADGVSAVFRSVVLDQHVGNAVLTGHSTKGADHVRSVTMDVQELTESRDTTGGIPAFIAAEQTSGPLRVPYHAGYSEIPSPHGEGPVETEALRQDAHRWGAQLARAGINTLLGPRETGTDESSAVRQGMTRARIATTATHFPGTDPSLAPFARAVDEGCPFVMMASATCTSVDDTRPAVHSPTVIGSLLRTRLGFDGIVMTDDVGDTAALEDGAPDEWATRFVDAGGDMVLTTSADTLPLMVAAVRERAESDPEFATKVDLSSLRVLRWKEEVGLLRPRTEPSGAFDPDTTRRLQRWLGLSESGVLGPETIGSLQYRVGAPTTGSWDARSFRRLQLYLGLEPDGTTIWDERTTTRLQRFLGTQR